MVLDGMIQKGNATLLQLFPKDYFAVDLDRSKCLHMTSSNSFLCTTSFITNFHIMTFLKVQWEKRLRHVRVDNENKQCRY